MKRLLFFAAAFFMSALLFAVPVDGVCPICGKKSVLTGGVVQRKGILYFEVRCEGGHEYIEADKILKEESRDGKKEFKGEEKHGGRMPGKEKRGGRRDRRHLRGGDGE